MQQRWWPVLIIALAALTVLFAACGGDDDDDSAADEDEPTEAASQTPEPEDGSRTRGNDDGDSADQGDASEFEALVSKFAEATFTASYDVTGLGTGDLGIQDAVFVIYKQGQERLRFDITGTIEGNEVGITFIENGAAGGFCFKGDIGLGIGGEDGACIQNEQLNDQFGSFTDQFEELENTDFEVLDESSREIAGQDAQCFKVRDMSDNSEQDICVSDGGGLLFLDDGEGTVFEANEYEDEVDDADFDLPYEVEEIPGLGG